MVQLGKPPAQSVPLALTRAVALRVVDLAGVPRKNRRICGVRVVQLVKLVWKTDIRAVSPGPSSAMKKAARAARELMEAVSKLDQKDREWVERVLARHSLLEKGALVPTVFQLALALNATTGEWVPRKMRITKRGVVKLGQGTLYGLVFGLLSAAAEAGGRFSVDKNFRKGSLLQALDVLRPYLPKGVVPTATALSKSYSNMQRVKSYWARLH